MSQTSGHALGTLIRKARTFTRVVLPSWLRHRSTILPLNVGAHPGLETAFVPTSDPMYRRLVKAVRRTRAFPYDLSVFLQAELEARYLPQLAHPAKVSLDIGAYVGFYSAALAPVSLRVLAFEANPHLIPYISANLQRYTNTYLLPFAVNDTTGEVVFNVPRATDGDALRYSAQGGILNSFVAQAGIASVAVSVPAIAVDALSLQNVGFMKIDVEGSEYAVLQGAAQTIARCRPNVIIENEYRHNPAFAQVFEYLVGQGYRGYFIDRSRQSLRPFAEFDIQRNQIALLDSSHNISDPDKYVFNFMFVPAEADPLASLVAK